MNQISGDKAIPRARSSSIRRLGLLLIPYLVGVACGIQIWLVDRSPYRSGLYALISVVAAVAVGFVGLIGNAIARFIAVRARFPTWSTSIAIAFFVGELTPLVLFFVGLVLYGHSLD